MPLPACVQSVEAAKPRIVLLLAIDQLRPDRLVDETLTGGLGRIHREGRVYTDAVLDHGFTETCPGHGTMLSGRHPGALGLPGNQYPDLEAGRAVYCVHDDAEDAVVFGGVPTRGGRSPRKLRATTLGDWLKAADAGARVFSVSGKDRSAIALAGRDADAAYWFNRYGRVGFTTSRYYTDALPDWVEAFRWQGAESGAFGRLPDSWTHDVRPPRSRIDDFIGESADLSRTSPHPLRDANAMKFASQVYSSPYLDDLTLDFATELVERESLGSGPGTDLLAVSLSATDVVGHRYGPYSHESWAALHSLDRRLGAFLELLEERAGSGQVLVALTSDHGVLPLPEWLEHRSTNTCPWQNGRGSMRDLLVDVNQALHSEYSKGDEMTKPWVVSSGSQLGISRPVARENGADPAAVLESLKARLGARPEIVKVWTQDEIATSEDPVAQLYRHSIDPERSGELVLQIPEGCLLARAAGTTHGSPYLYDRRVPLVFWGAGIEPARVPARARTVDIAPTLAARMGLAVPGDLDGKALLE